MINLKTREEILIMKEGGRRLRKIIEQLKKKIKVGITTNYLNQIAERLIEDHGGKPSFKTVKNYLWAICTPINEQIVHTPPSRRVLKEGDLLTIDIGFQYKSYHSDYAETFVVGKKYDREKKFFLTVGKQALEEAIKQVKVGNYIADISNAIEKNITKRNYFIIKDLGGHGIGKELHEEPFVPGYFNGKKEETPLIKEGMALAIEVIYSQGTKKMVYEKGQPWSIITADRSLSACFETTVIATKKEPLVIV